MPNELLEHDRTLGELSDDGSDEEIVERSVSMIDRAEYKRPAGAAGSDAAVGGVRPRSAHADHEPLARLGLSPAPRYARTGLEKEIVGRDEELSVLGRVLDRAAGEAAACTIEGEPGVGKTTLWNAGLDLAVTRGYGVIRAHPAEAETAFSFAALGDLLRGRLDDVLPRLPAPQRRALEAALLIADAGDSPPNSHAVAVAALTTLELIASERPLVIGVDDAQWLDSPSRQVISFFARRLPPRTCVLATERVEGERASTPAFPAERIRLGPISIGAMHRLVHERLEIDLPRRTLLRVHEASGGNPMYALELAGALVETGVELAPGEPLPVPGTLRELVAQRLAQISPAARRELLPVAASARPTRELLAPGAAEEAAEAGVLVLEGDRIRFVHPLFASVLYADASAGERRDAHRRLSATVAEMEEAARHLALAKEAPDDEVALRLDEAATHARTRGAPSAAAELKEKAVELTPPSREMDRIRRALEAAELHHEARSGAVDPLLQRVLPQTTGNLRGRALRLLGYQQGLAVARGGVPAFEEALEHVDDPVLEAEIRLELVNPFFSVLSEESVAHAERAVELAERIGDPGLLAAALALRANLRHRTDDLERASRLEEAGASGVLARLIYASALLGTGEADEARALLERLQEQAQASGLRQENWALTLRVRAEAFSGNFRRAKDVAEYFLHFPQQEGTNLSTIAAHGDRAFAEAYLGEVDAARGDAETSVSLADATGFTGRSIMGRWTLGFVELSLGDTAAAWHHFDEAIARLSPTVERAWPFHAFLTIPILLVDATETLAALGRHQEATPMLEWFQRHPGNQLREALQAHCRGVLDTSSGTEEGLADAVKRLEELSVPFQLGRALLALGSAQRRALRKRKARESLRRAAEIFERLESPLWAEKSHRELTRIGGRAATPTELTASERRVAELVANGKTNKEVAAELVVGPRTVEAALTRVYAKLGIRSRTELARRMVEAGKP